MPTLEGNAGLKVKCADKILDLSKPVVMGVLNLASDSFFDGGVYCQSELAIRRLEVMVQEGALIVDIGAESSRPFSAAISLQEELDRIGNVISSIKNRFDVLLSVDTYKPEIMAEVIKLGANMINDIYALQKPGALDIIAASDVAVVLMHMQNIPENMQINPTYHHLVPEITCFLQSRVDACLSKGVAETNIILDPGFGFGKTTAHNLQLLKNLSSLKKMGYPILAGLSRKASIGEILSLPVEKRLYGSISAHVIAVMQGASIIRTHDIKPTVEAIKIATAVLQQETMVC